ncbi:Cytosolic Fe-S cluster assembly factor NAR1 [Nosema granulosis]|uniref:Cytosolic Fe-S cluster assembly factor NAR1 n=1 Tax=Nosema granulosis TaxID=83296 RepID=A0A9P6GVZ1_9MICR|nr:Cytosolic Fe-S cluster assembly factor NAR1 [Nosema granulosis]
MRNIFSEKNQNKSCVKEDGGEFKFHLNDCLACSGCITDSEDIIGESKIDEIYNIKENVSFLISPQSKFSVYNYINLGEYSFEEFEDYLAFFLKEKYKVDKIFDTSHATKIIGEALILEENKVISDCPGTVMYIERQAPHLVDKLSKILTAQQLLSNSIAKTIVISVVPCYDKKLEASEKDTNLNYVLTTYEFMNLLLKLNFKIQKTPYKCANNEKFQMNIGMNTGGYLEYVLFEKYSENGIKDIKKKYTDLKTISTIHIRNNSKGKHIEKEKWTDLNNIKIDNIKKGVKYIYRRKSSGYFIYEFLVNGVKEVYIRINGVENLINFMKETKSKEFTYKLVEIYICNFGCLNGPGQLNFEDITNNIEMFRTYGNINTIETSFKTIENLKLRSFVKKEMKQVKFDVQW